MSSEEQKAPTASSKKDSAMRQSAIRHASQISGSTKKAEKPKDVSEFVKTSRAVLDFTIMTLMAQRALLDELAEMTDDEKLETLFELLDKSGDGYVDATELADGLRKVRGDVNFEESLVLAIDRVATFDKEGTGKLNKADFKSMVTALSEVLGTNFHELSEMMVMAVLFEEGNTLEEDVAGAIVAEGVTEVVKEEAAARKAMTDKRMKALFQLFDLDGSGTVDFKEVVIGMFRISEDLEGSSKAAMVALMMFDEDSSRSLNYDQFAKFIINIVAASPENVTFDDVADAMTIAASQPVEMTPEELLAVLMLDETMQEVMDLKEEADKHMEVSKAQLTRIGKLFKLWDLNSDGTVDIKELALGLRKFEETADMQTTVDEAIKLMDSFDLDGDQALSPKEFVIFIVQFANLAGTDLDEILDFLITVSALKENTDAEVKYIQSLKESDIYFWHA